MKKLFGFASVFALAAGFSLSSCSSDEVVEDVNPNYDGQSEIVKTQFAISVPAVSKSSRMTDDEAQTNRVFKGLTDIHVFTFKGAKSLGDEQLATAQIKGTFGLEPVEELSSNSNAKRYNDVKIDLGVDRMVFYGKSAYGSAGDPVAAGEIVVPTWSQWKKNNINFIKFGHKTVDGLGTGLESDDHGKQILGFLNELFGDLDSESTSPFYWSEASSSSELKKLYSQIVKLQNGSAVSVANVASDLYTRLQKIEEGEEPDNKIKAALVSVIKKYFNGTDASVDVYSLTWKQGDSFPVEANVFPENLGLPVGVALLNAKTISKATTFTYNKDGKSTSVSIASENKAFTGAKDIVKPLPLYYYANSTLAVANDAKLNSLTSGKWSSIIESYGEGKNGAVNMNTQSVAMIEQVNYAVAQLNTIVKLSSSEIKDHEHALGDGEEQVQSNVDVTNGFEVTGILVGGQKNVDWKFEQVEGTTYTVYDKTMSGQSDVMTAKRSNPAKAIPTLVFESAKNENVYIAVEFKNLCEDFYGANGGIVKKGSKFYLVAPLKINPEYSNESEGFDNTKIFQKDFTTNAILTVTDLSNAYLTIPDLRAPKMEFGLSVDLEWKQGYEFEQDFE